jgi:anti-sigma regulatory factor (Ser/Thr protein kinase)
MTAGASHAVRERTGRLSNHGLSLVISGGPRAVAEARDAIGLLSRDLGLDVIDLLRLLISELVTNSVRHGGAGHDGIVKLEVSVSNGRVRAEVMDLGPGFSRRHLRAPAPGAESGWGLTIVERLAADWGTNHGGRCVWVELARG